MGNYIFLDTNIFLHYQDFDQIDWLSLIEVDSVNILIPPVTIRELNFHKDNPQSQKRIKKRAESILIKLYKYFENDNQHELQNSIKLILEDRDPMVDFADYQLKWEINDDHLIANILMFKAENTNEEAVLITSDFGLVLRGKAKRLGIKTIVLEKKYKLKDVPDADKEAISKLQKELERFRDASPKLGLIFPNNNQFVNFNLSKPVSLSNSEINKQMEKVKSQFPKMDEKNQGQFPKEIKNSDVPKLYWITFASPSSFIAESDIIKYNEELDKYYDLYKDFLRERVNYENNLGKTVQLDIVLENTGTAPGENIDIKINFEKNFIINVSEEPPLSPIELKPPSPPKSLAEKMSHSEFDIAGYTFRNEFLNVPKIEVDPKVTYPIIDSTNGFNVNFHVNIIKHGIKLCLDPLFITFKSYNSAASFNFNYDIFAANVPSKISGTLNVVIDK